MGQDGRGAGYGAEFGLVGAFLFEVVALAIFIVVILGATSDGGNATMAGLVIGATPTMIHLVGITATGTSVNPARSMSPALFVGGKALA
ncbi:MAG: aquaporin [Pseudomonadota bacterium]